MAFVISSHSSDWRYLSMDADSRKKWVWISIAIKWQIANLKWNWYLLIFRFIWTMISMHVFVYLHNNTLECERRTNRSKICCNISTHHKYSIKVSTSTETKSHSILSQSKWQCRIKGTKWWFAACLLYRFWWNCDSLNQCSKPSLLSMFLFISFFVSFVANSDFINSLPAIWFGKNNKAIFASNSPSPYVQWLLILQKREKKRNRLSSNQINCLPMHYILFTVSDTTTHGSIQFIYPFHPSFVLFMVAISFYLVCDSDRDSTQTKLKQIA